MHFHTDPLLNNTVLVWMLISWAQSQNALSRAAKTEKIEKQSLQHAVNLARQATEMIKHS